LLTAVKIEGIWCNVSSSTQAMFVSAHHNV